MTETQILGFFGGVGAFLYGMTLMSAGLRQACGNRLQKILEKATGSRLRAVSVGLGLTLLVQSSSATGAMVIGFVSSGFMTLLQAAQVTLGANIGTTVTAQITAFELSKFAPLLIFIGALLALFFKKELPKAAGSFLLGFGLLFQGIAWMKAAIAPLAQNPAVAGFLGEMDRPLLLVLFGTVFTALLQSSSSSTVIFQAFAAEGLIDLRAAAFLLVGAAIGSVAPNFLAALTGSRNGTRVALFNLVYNLVRGVIVSGVLLLVPASLSWIEALSPGDVARQVANAHTLFALVTVLLCLPLDRLLVRLVERLLPLGEEEKRRLSDYSLHYMKDLQRLPASMALELIRQELIRMGNRAADNLELAVDCFFHLEEEKIRRVAENEAVVDWLERAVIDGMSRLRAGDLTGAEMDSLYRLSLTVSDMERLSDYAENITEHAVNARREQVSFSPAALEELSRMAELATGAVRLELKIFTEGCYERLPEAEALEARVDEAQNRMMAAHVQRLLESSCNPLGGVIFTDMATELERCADHGLNIAYALSGKHEKKEASAILASV